MAENMTEPCVFCSAPTWDVYEGAEEGVAGRRIGEKMICEGCLNEIKNALGINELEGWIEEVIEKFK